jgi:hypothetical protein
MKKEAMQPQCYVCQRPQSQSPKLEATKAPILCSNVCARSYNKVRLQRALTFAFS